MTPDAMPAMGAVLGLVCGIIVTGDGLSFAAMLAGAALLDRLVRPRPSSPFAPAGRSRAGTALNLTIVAAACGAMLALSGSVPVSIVLTLALVCLLVLISNAKHAVLGEPLVFSDFALFGAVFQHPQFYLSAIPLWQRVAVCLGLAGLLAVLWALFVPEPWPHVAGTALLAGALALLALLVRSGSVRGLAREPDAHADVLRHGLLPTLLLYLLRWRESRDPPPAQPVAGHPQLHDAPAPELIVVVQCESFADPVELFGEPSLALPALEAARAAAAQWGRLHVSGFGAYTMRTEYGVLFGRGEAALGFRRYDPFLTALGEASYALPARLAGAGWRSLFVHPHDMRFYGRDRIMPAGGFAELVGEEHFAARPAGGPRYVPDAEVAERILALARAAREPTLLYAVTIENHGPWAPTGSAAPGRAQSADLLASYLRLVRNSDAMLETLIAGLGTTGRPALLVFFGDHRPSIPGVAAPGGERHTPYVMLRLDGHGAVSPADNRPADLTPADLHHVILRTVLGDHASPPTR